MIELSSKKRPAADIVGDLQSILPRLAVKDSSLWGVDAEGDAAVRLGWITSPEQALDLLPKIAEFVKWAGDHHLDRVVLCGMGGSSLAPEVICRVYGKEITIVDSTDPGQIHSAIFNRLPNTVVVISSKSGSTIETASAMAAFEYAFKAAELSPLDHMMIVTDPDSPLEKSASASGYRILTADPTVGGRYSALTTFGLLPSALAGVNIAELIHDADSVIQVMSSPESPAVTLAALLAEHEKTSAFFSLLAPDGIGNWVEQLVAESTGKANHGLLPIVVETCESAGFEGEGILSIALNEKVDAEIKIDGPLGAQFVLWEWATALLGRSIGINPFDQPNVAESKEKTSITLEHTDQLAMKSSTRFGSVEVFGDFDGVTLADTLNEFFDQVPEHGYLALMVFLDRFVDAQASNLRNEIGKIISQPVTFGWGPRFLHSTGQFHKGHPTIGAFLQITGDVKSDYPIPDRPYSFHTLQMAQAIGDGLALSARGVPLIRLHLTDRYQGLIEIAAAVSEVTRRRVTS